MPRYHFNVHDGIRLPDAHGRELPGLAAARAAAVDLTAELLKGSAHDFWQGEEWKLEVTDETGLILFTLLFLGLDAPCLG